MGAVKTGDIVYLETQPEGGYWNRFGEIGSGKKRDKDTDAILHQVFRLAQDATNETRGTYERDPVWVSTSSIISHLRVKNASTFHDAWEQLGFSVQTCDQGTSLVFQCIGEDDGEELRSIDSYSTLDSDDESSINSFVINE